MTNPDFHQQFVKLGKETGEASKAVTKKSHYGIGAAFGIAAVSLGAVITHYMAWDAGQEKGKRDLIEAEKKRNSPEGQFRSL